MIDRESVEPCFQLPVFQRTVEPEPESQPDARLDAVRAGETPEASDALELRWQFRDDMLDEHVGVMDRVDVFRAVHRVDIERNESTRCRFDGRRIGALGVKPALEVGAIRPGDDAAANRERDGIPL